MSPIWYQNGEKKAIKIVHFASKNDDKYMFYLYFYYLIIVTLFS